MLLTFFLVLPIGLNGQVSKILKSKAKSEASKEADKKVESKALSIRDRLLGTIDDQESSDSLEVDEVNEGEEMVVQPAINPMRGMFVSESQVKHKDIYKFDGKIVMEMQAVDEESDFDGVILYTTYINTSNNDFAFEMQTVSAEDPSAVAAMSMVYDNDNQVVLMLTNTSEGKLALVTGFDNEDFMEEMEEDEDDYSYMKTGKTKTILGYKCDEYRVEDEEGTASIWVSREVPFKPNREQLKKTGIPVQFDGPNGEGMIMEMESFEDGVKTGSMVVKEIDEKSGKTISLAGYSFLNMNDPSSK